MTDIDRRATTPGSTGWRAVVHRRPESLAAAAGEWDDLLRRCPQATVFQSLEWTDAWWRAYGRPGALRLVLVRRDGRLVAGAALIRTLRAGVGVLRPLGTPISDWSDVLVDPSAPGAATALSNALLAEPGWAVLDLPEVSGTGHVRRLLTEWPGVRSVTPSSVHQSLPVAPMDELIGSLTGKNRANVRRALRRIDAAGLTERELPAGEVAAGVRRLLDLHRRQWAGRGGMNPEHGRARFARHLTAAVTAMVPAGRAALVEYVLDGDVVGSSLLLTGRAEVDGYLYGVEPALFGRFNVTTLLTRTAMELAVARGADRFGMLRGREDYKQAWRPEPSRNDRVLLVRPGHAGGAGYAAAVRAGASLREHVRTHLPGARDAAARTRRLLWAAAPARRGERAADQRGRPNSSRTTAADRGF